VVPIENTSQLVKVGNQNSNTDDGSAEKVLIPDHVEESDADSETLSEKLRKIDAYNEVG
jgi:hypothetical protein